MLVWYGIRLQQLTFSDVKGTADKLNYFQALPGVCTFTGCDYIPAFLKKGKKRPIEIMLKSYIYQSFNKIGEEDLLTRILM